MWTLLLPLSILIIVLLYQIGLQENFVTTTTTTKDASGNIVDASGSTTVVTPSTMIQLSLSDILTLLKPTTVTATTTTPTLSQTTQTPTYQPTYQPTQGETAAEFYDKIRPSLLNDIRSTVSAQLQGSPFVPAAPISTTTADSDCTAQGVELQTAKMSLENNSDYIRKDSIPCYNCSL